MAGLRGREAWKVSPLAERMSAGTDMSEKDADTTLDNAAHGGCPAKTCYALHFGDCADGAPFKADAIVTDPPYQIGKAWKRAFHGRRGKSPLWGDEQAWDKLHPLVPALPTMADKVVIWGGNFYPLPPGAMVCDPFMGSGTTGVACARLGLSFTGWEQDATHYARAKERIEAEYSKHNKAFTATSGE
jgi:tRNA G10  N-methylase Trm11